MVKGVKGNLKSAVERFNNQSNKKSIATSLRKSGNVKSTKHLVAIDPITKQLVSGNITQIAKKLNTSPAVIKNRFKGRQQFKDVKGFTLLRFQTPEDMVSFKSGWKPQDAKVLKQKAKPIISGAKYLDALAPSFNVKDVGSFQNQKWGTAEHRYELDINSDGLSKNQLEQIFAQTSLDTIKQQKLKANDLIRVVIKDPNLKNGFASIPLMPVKNFSVSKIFKVFEEVVESNEEYELSGDTQLVFTSVNKPQLEEFALGSYEPSIHKLNVAMKKSIIQIKNKDNMCVARAIATGICRVECGVNSKEYDNCKRGRKIQETLAKQLLKRCGMNECKLTIKDIMNIEDYIPYQITMIDGDDYNNILYPNINSKDYIPPEYDEDTIYLYCHKGHCDLINNNRVAGFFGKENFCHKCKKCYKDKEKHKCKFKCNMCCKSNCPAINLQNKKFTIHCEGCDRWFPCNDCFDNHLEPDKKGNSVCDKVWKCQTCKKVLSRETQPPETHKCGDYLCSNCKRIVPKDHRCYMYPKKLKPPSEKYIFFDFESDISGEEHIVMYSVSMKFDSPEPIFHNNIDEFCEWAFNPENKGYTFIAHNGKGYDYKFVIRWLYEKTDYQPFIIFGGQKIMYMSIPELSIRFIDSLCFLTMPLKAFPKTFGEKELKKGYFPHWFNTKANWDYEGPMPPADEFKYNAFKEKDRNDFIKWYDKKVKENYIWNQKKEMKEYCISDVDILRKCCIKFRQLYIDTCEIDPFQYLTIASVCMAIYKYHYVDLSYPYRDKLFRNTWTGDPSKYPDEKREAYNKAKKEFDEETIEIVEREARIGIIPFKELDWIRQSFFGGRTNAVKLLYHFKEGEEGKYSDITSLYPTVNYYDEYPAGHYEILNNQYCIDNQYEVLSKVRKKEYFGFIECEVSPPKNLYHPVLPVKKGKLVFDLNDKRGVWCSNELNLAIDKGYKILKVFEVRYYPKTMKGIFKEYVAKFLKIKQESSGYPDWVNTEEDKDKYIQDYKTNQGVLMDKDKIEKNPGLRAIAKLCLNSLWGKFGQRTNMGKTEIVNNKADFFKIVFNDKYDNIDWIDISDTKVQVSYTIKDKYVENDFNTNLAVASFTTSSARLRLYEALDKLQQQILYFDTDSVVYKYNDKDPNSYKLENGDYLGDWTDELEGEKMIGTFVSGGPKNYSYETDDGHYHTKVKGFNLNYEVSQKINHLSMIDLVKNVLEDQKDFTGMSQVDIDEYNKKHKINVEYDTIKRGKGHILTNEHQEKNYGLVYDKRSIQPADENGDYDTLPFGYENTI